MVTTYRRRFTDTALSINTIRLQRASSRSWEASGAVTRSRRPGAYHVVTPRSSQRAGTLAKPSGGVGAGPVRNIGRKSGSTGRTSALRAA
jgi:hypothetical protein